MPDRSFKIGQHAFQRAHAAGVDRYIGAHAGAQFANVLIGFELNAQRHALHDLDPIAAGVLRRQDRKLRARARRNRADFAAPASIRERIDRDRRGQAGMDVRQIGFFRIGVDPKAAIGDDGEDRRPHHRDASELDLRHLRRDAGDRRDNAGVAQISLGVLDLRFGLHVIGKILQRRIERAAELDQRRTLLLLDESEDLLGLNQRGGRCVGVNRRAGALCEQSRFAIIIGLADLDRVGPHLDLIFVALVRYAKVLIGDLRRFEPALGERQSDAVRGRIDFEQFVADLDMLSLDDIDVQNRARHLRRDQDFVGADIGVVGGDIAPASQPPIEAAGDDHRRQQDQQHEASSAAPSRLDDGRGRSGGLGRRRRRRDDGRRRRRRRALAGSLAGVEGRHLPQMFSLYSSIRS